MPPQLPQANQTAVISDTGQPGYIPTQNLQTALARGFKVATMATSPQGQTGLIPVTNMPQALQRGFKIGPASQQRSDESLQQSANPNQPGAVSQAWQDVNRPTISGDTMMNAAGALQPRATGGAWGAEFDQKEGESTADYVKRIAMMPPTQTEARMAQITPTAAPIVSGAIRGAAGAINDAYNVAGSFTSPLSLATMFLGAAAKAPGAAGVVAKSLGVGAGAGFTIKGLSDTDAALRKITGGEGATPENIQNLLNSLAMVSGGTAGTMSAGGSLEQDIAKKIASKSPQTVTIAGQKVQVLPEQLQQELSKQQVAAQQGVKSLATDTANKVIQPWSAQIESAGNFHEAADAARAQAKPVYQALDSVSDGEFSKLDFQRRQALRNMQAGRDYAENEKVFDQANSKIDQILQKSGMKSPQGTTFTTRTGVLDKSPTKIVDIKGANGEEIGSVTAKPIDGQTWQVHDSVVKEQFQNKGYGPAAYEQMADYAKQNGVNKLTSSVTENRSGGTDRGWQKLQAKYPDQVKLVGDHYEWDLTNRSRMDVGMLDQARQTWGNAALLDKLHAAVERSYSVPEDVAGDGSMQTRTMDGSKLRNSLNTLFNGKRGMDIQRLVGDDVKQNLYNIAKITETPTGAQAFQQMTETIAKAAGHGPILGTIKDVATASNFIARQIATSPTMGRMATSFLQNKISPQVYVPIMLSLMAQKGQQQQQPDYNTAAMQNIMRQSGMQR